MKNINEYLNLVLESDNKISTASQEVLTCLFLDLCINEGKDIKDLLNGDIDFDFKPIEGIVTKENITSMPKKWKDSFKYQVESFENFLKKNKFNTPIAFVHHDTKLGFLNGNTTYDYSAIVDRVNAGSKDRNLGTTSSKDDYQKADIYAVSNGFKVDAKPLKSIENEKDWWIDNKENVLGISLKQLVRAIPNPHLYNFDSISDVTGSIEKIHVEFNPFKIKKNDIVGNVTSQLKFIVDWKDERMGKVINLRCGGPSVNLENHKFDEYFRPNFFIELMPVNYSPKILNTMGIDPNTISKSYNSAQEGKLKNQLDKIVTVAPTEKKNIESIDNLVSKTAQLENLISGFSNVTINKIEAPSQDLKTLVDNVKNNLNNVPENEKEKFAKVIKWDKIVEKQILYLEAIFNLAAKQPNKEEALDEILLKMMLAAKGINVEKTMDLKNSDLHHLPYLMIG